MLGNSPCLCLLVLLASMATVARAATMSPTGQPSSQPSSQPSAQPSAQPSGRPTKKGGAVSMVFVANSTSVFFSMHTNQNCTTTPYGIKHLTYLDETDSTKFIQLNSCLQETGGASFKLSCKLGADAYTLTKATYASTDQSCAQPPVSFAKFKHDQSCTADQRFGGYLAAHCGEDAVLRPRLLSMPSVQFPALYSNPACVGEGSGPKRKIRWTDVCTPHYLPGPSSGSPTGHALQFNYLLSVIEQSPSLTLRQTRFDKRDLKCIRRVQSVRTFTYPPVAQGLHSAAAACLQDPFFPAFWYLNFANSAVSGAPYIPMQGGGAIFQGASVSPFANFFDAAQTISPSARPTPQPSALPTARPSAAPTAPSPQPSALPTRPSAAPTAAPTPVPSAAPTAAPTPVPSAPTAAPTPVPSPVPTTLPDQLVYIDALRAAPSYTGSAVFAGLGSGVTFDGVSQYLSFGSMFLNLGTKGFSAKVTFSLTSLSNWERILDINSGTTSYIFLTVTELANNAMIFRFAYTENGVEQITDYRATPIVVNTIYTIAVVYDPTVGSTGSTSIFFNGAKAVTNTAMATKGTDKTYTSSYVGKSAWAADPYLSGSIYSMEVYNLALTDAQAQSLTITARYVRFAMTGGSTLNTHTEFVELQALTASGVNRALNAPVTQITAIAVERGTISALTNGNTALTDYLGFMPGPVTLQIDLGAVYSDIATIKFWNYWDTRSYYGVQILVSADGSTWKTLYGPITTNSVKAGIVVQPLA